MQIMRLHLLRLSTVLDLPQEAFGQSKVEIEGFASEILES